MPLIYSSDEQLRVRRDQCDQSSPQRGHRHQARERRGQGSHTLLGNHTPQPADVLLGGARHRIRPIASAVPHGAAIRALINLQATHDGLDRLAPFWLGAPQPLMHFGLPSRMTRSAGCLHRHSGQLGPRRPPKEQCLRHTSKWRRLNPLFFPYKTGIRTPPPLQRAFNL